MNGFDETDHPRRTDGRFAPKTSGASAEPGRVDLTEPDDAVQVTRAAGIEPGRHLPIGVRIKRVAHLVDPPIGVRARVRVDLAGIGRLHLDRLPDGWSHRLVGPGQDNPDRADEADRAGRHLADRLDLAGDLAAARALSGGDDLAGSPEHVRRVVHARLGAGWDAPELCEITDDPDVAETATSMTLARLDGAARKPGADPDALAGPLARTLLARDRWARAHPEHSPYPWGNGPGGGYTERPLRSVLERGEAHRASAERSLADAARARDRNDPVRAASLTGRAGSSRMWARANRIIADRIADDELGSGRRAGFAVASTRAVPGADDELGTGRPGRGTGPGPHPSGKP